MEVRIFFNDYEIFEILSVAGESVNQSIKWAAMRSQFL